MATAAPSAIILLSLGQSNEFYSHYTLYCFSMAATIMHVKCNVNFLMVHLMEECLSDTCCIKLMQTEIKM